MSAKDGNAAEDAVSFQFASGYYSSGEIAPIGQASAHAPQLMHTFGSIEYTSPSLIAPEGHSPWQVPHATQVSGLILYAIEKFLYTPANVSDKKQIDKFFVSLHLS